MFLPYRDPRRLLGRWSSVLVACLLFAALPHGTRAQAPADSAALEPSAYRTLIAEGLLEFRLHHYEEARALFARAHAMYPNARTHRALGLADFELRDYVAAAIHLELALSSEARPLDDDLRAETQEVLQRAYGFVARARLSLMPASAQLLVDGQVAQRAADGALLLRIGERELEASAAGHVSHRDTLAITGGEQLILQINLLPAAEPRAVATAPVIAPALPARRDDRASEHRPWYKNPWLWTGVGIVLAGTAAGVAVALTHPDSGGDTSYGGTSGTFVRGP